MGKSSSLPASISKISISFDGIEKNPKLPVGPTFARPGPILLKQVTVAVRLVSKSKGSMETITNIIAMSKKYRDR